MIRRAASLRAKRVKKARKAKKEANPRDARAHRSLKGKKSVAVKRRKRNAKVVLLMMSLRRQGRKIVRQTLVVTRLRARCRWPMMQVLHKLLRKIGRARKSPRLTEQANTASTKSFLKKIKKLKKRPKKLSLIKRANEVGVTNQLL